MTETVDVFYQETNYVTLLLFCLSIIIIIIIIIIRAFVRRTMSASELNLRRQLMHVTFYCMFPFIFECLVFFLFITLYYVYDLIINK